METDSCTGSLNEGAGELVDHNPAAFALAFEALLTDLGADGHGCWRSTARRCAARNRADNGPENLAILRRLTLNLLRTARPKIPVSRKRTHSGWSGDLARSIIGQMR